MQRKTEILFIGAGLVVLVVAIIAAALFSSSASTGPRQVKATTVPALSSADWTRGNNAAKVSFIEYGDFQCPACGEYQPMIKQAVAAYGDRVAFSFRNFPLYQIHQNAMISSQAAEAAGVQGKYWEMHDLLYVKQDEWSAVSADVVVAKYFNGYAQSLGLDVAKFDADIASPAIKNKIQHDLDTGNAAEVDHTPTFFINLTQIANPSSYAELSAAIERALALATAE